MMAKQKRRPVLVVVCGGSGSGKTTVAEMIGKNLGSDYSYQIVSLDNFYLTKDKIKTSNFDIPEALDWTNILKCVMSLIHDQVETEIPVFDFKTHTYSSFKKVKPSDVVIVEGILSLNSEFLRQLADLTIYIDVPDDERLIRRILRDVEARGTDVRQTVGMWRDSVIEAHHKYVDSCKNLADLIIPWQNINETAIIACAGAIRYKSYTSNKDLLRQHSKRMKEVTEESKKASESKK